MVYSFYTLLLNLFCNSTPIALFSIFNCYVIKTIFYCSRFFYFSFSNWISDGVVVYLTKVFDFRHKCYLWSFCLNTISTTIRFSHFYEMLLSFMYISIIFCNIFRWVFFLQTSLYLLHKRLSLNLKFYFTGNP